VIRYEPDIRRSATVRAYTVIRWVRAVDEQTVFANTAEEAAQKSDTGDVEDSERTGEATGIRSVHRDPAEDERCAEAYGPHDPRKA
jgi:hypothetical protein